MKRIVFCSLLALLCLLWSCEGSIKQTDGAAVGGYLDSAYVSKTYRASMDSIQASSGITEGEFKQLQGFMRDYRERIQGHPTYRELLASATGLDAMRSGIVLKVESFSLHTDQKIVEVRIVLGIENKMDLALGKLRANVAWLDEGGKVVTHTPSFTVEGPIAAGGTVANLRLEYPLYKPTGNELNDPKLQAARDTLELVEQIAKRKDLSAFKLCLHDFQLANGLSPAAYWLMPVEERSKHPDLPAVKPSDRMPLLKWAEKNKATLEKLVVHDSPYNLMLSPVITERVEASHGKNLILDRVGKVHAYFTTNQHIPASNINDGTVGRKVVLEEIIDFWNWPMEIRVYEQ